MVLLDYSWGLPLSLWNKETFRNVVATQATKVVDIDEATLTLENVEFSIFKSRISTKESKLMEACIQWL